MSYDPNEERDASGKWTGGGGGAPSMGDLKKLGATSSSWKVREPSTMKPHEINKELDKLDRISSQINTDMIQQGRGHETPSQTRTKSDALSLRYVAVSDRQYALHQEIGKRYGPGAPSRLPQRRVLSIGRRVTKL